MYGKLLLRFVDGHEETIECDEFIATDGVLMTWMRSGNGRFGERQFPTVNLLEWRKL
jgi:hypothetical protein